MRRGAAGIEQSQIEQDAARTRDEQRAEHTAYRLFLKAGEGRHIIVLDAQLAQIPFLYEHTLFDDQNRVSGNELCVKDFGSCPACNGEGDFKTPRASYYGMFLSVLDTAGYTDRDGNFVPFARRLLVVKGGQHNDFIQLFDSATRQHGTIRGMQIYLVRGHAQNDPAIGKPTLFNDEVTQTDGMFAMWSEEDLTAQFAHEDVFSQNGALLIPANGMQQPFDYGKLFPRPDPDAMRAKYNASPVPGSRAANALANAQPGAIPQGRTGRTRTPDSQPAPAANNGPARRIPPAATAPAQQPAQQPAAAPARTAPGRAPAASNPPPARRRTID